PIKPKDPFTDTKNFRQTTQLASKRFVHSVIEPRYNEPAIRKFFDHLGGGKNKITLAFRFAQLTERADKRNVVTDVMKRAKLVSKRFPIAKIFKIETILNHRHLVTREDHPEFFTDELRNTDRPR